MKSGILYVFENQEIDYLLGIGFIKERFRNGDFINEHWVTIAQRQDVSEKCDVLYSTLKPHLIQKYNMEDFHQLHLPYYTKVKELDARHQLNLSWLEILQIATISRLKNISEETHLLEISQGLLKFYSKVIKSLDF